MLRILKHLIARYRRRRRAGQVWVNGRRMSQTEVVEDVQRY